MFWHISSIFYINFTLRQWTGRVERARIIYFFLTTTEGQPRGRDRAQGQLPPATLLVPPMFICLSSRVGKLTTHWDCNRDAWRQDDETLKCSVSRQLIAANFFHHTTYTQSSSLIYNYMSYPDCYGAQSEPVSLLCYPRASALHDYLYCCGRARRRGQWHATSCIFNTPRFTTSLIATAYRVIDTTQLFW